MWSQEYEAAFQRLKATLCASPILTSPNFQKEFIVQTDASDRGVGAVFSQQDNQGNDKPVAFYSRKLLPREERYSVIERVPSNKVSSTDIPPVPHGSEIPYTDRP